jgi:hypothetical protein
MSMANRTFFFDTNFIRKFKEDIIAYCKAQNYNLELTDAEIEHLSWHVGSDYQSPEAGKNTDKDFNFLPFEIKRSIVRRYSFELLLRGNEADYQEFVQGQDKELKLSSSRFQALSKEAGELDKDAQAAIRASALLVMSPQMKKICSNCPITDELRQTLKNNGLSQSMSDDSEEFISQFAILAALHPELTPMTKALTLAQNKLIKKAFWPQLHMRWLYSTEGGNNMTRSLAQGIQRKEFSPQDLLIWAWRWRLNVAGFQGGPGAKFYDSVSDQLIEKTLVELNKLFTNPDHQFLHHYLVSNAHAAGLSSSDLRSADIDFLGHLIVYLAYFHRVDIFTRENVQAVLAGYKNFLQDFSDQGDLASLYLHACNNYEAITPTYVPGTMDSALGLLKYHEDSKLADSNITDGNASLPNKIDISALFKAYPANTATAIAKTIRFMCQLLSEIYKTALSQRISCMNIAKVENLNSVIEKWLQNPHSIKFSFTEKMEVVANYVQEPAPKPTMSLSMK